MAYSISHMSNAALVGSTSSARLLGIFFPPISNMTHLLILVSLDRLAVTYCVNAIASSFKVRHSRMFLAGIQAKARTGPPIKTFGGDDPRIKAPQRSMVASAFL